jgi:hypothetical protein
MLTMDEEMEAFDLPEPEEPISIWHDPDDGHKHIVAAAIAEAKDTVIQIGDVVIMGGSRNGCPVDRLIRVELVNGVGHRLAEPTVVAVCVSAVSLIKAQE